MSRQFRQTTWCVAILVVGLAFVGLAIYAGNSIGWNLMSPVPGWGRSVPLVVVPSLFLLGAGAFVIALYLIRLPADRYVSSPDDDKSV